MEIVCFGAVAIVLIAPVIWWLGKSTQVVVKAAVDHAKTVQEKGPQDIFLIDLDLENSEWVPWKAE